MAAETPSCSFNGDITGNILPLLSLSDRANLASTCREKHELIGGLFTQTVLSSTLTILVSNETGRLCIENNGNSRLVTPEQLFVIDRQVVVENGEAVGEVDPTKGAVYELDSSLFCRAIPLNMLMGYIAEEPDITVKDVLIKFKKWFVSAFPSWIPQIFRDINPDMTAYRVQKIYEGRIAEGLLAGTVTGAYTAPFNMFRVQDLGEDNIIGGCDKEERPFISFVVGYKEKSAEGKATKCVITLLQTANGEDPHYDFIQGAEAPQTTLLPAPANSETPAVIESLTEGNPYEPPLPEYGEQTRMEVYLANSTEEEAVPLTDGAAGVGGSEAT